MAFNKNFNETRFSKKSSLLSLFDIGLIGKLNITF